MSHDQIVRVNRCDTVSEPFLLANLPTQCEMYVKSNRLSQFPVNNLDSFSTNFHNSVLLY